MKLLTKPWSVLWHHTVRFYLRCIATKNLLKIGWWIVRGTAVMNLHTMKPVRTPEQLGDLNERTYWFNHEMEEISAMLGEEPDDPRGVFVEETVNKLFRVAWRCCDRTYRRADRIHKRRLTAPEMLKRAERDIVARFGGGSQERVIFMVSYMPSDPSLYVLCAGENSPQWNTHGRRMSVISCTKRHVYEALVKTQAEGTPEYLRVSEALLEPDSETSELMRTLYFSETLGFHEAHRASLALTT
jgi:hypothetical protein